MKSLKTLLFAFAGIALPTLVQAASPIRYVQISTNTLTRQSGTLVVQGANISTATISSMTLTNVSVTNVSVSSLTATDATINRSTATFGNIGTLIVSNPVSSFTITNAAISSATIQNATVAIATVTTSLSMNAQRILNQADGVASTDSASFGQVHLMQIPQFASETTGATTASTAFILFGSTLTITPTSASSKIAIFGVAPCNVGSATDGHSVALGVGRNGTALFTRAASPANFVTGGVSTALVTSLSFFYLDSPATTSATRYQLMMASGTGDTATCGATAGAGLSTFIMVMEVK